MATIKYNVGAFTGLNGTAVVYEAVTASGLKFLAHKVLLAGNVVKWLWLSRSYYQTQMALQFATLANAVKITDYSDTVPAGTNDADGYLLVDNETDPVLPRIYTNQAMFSLKGAGVEVWTGTDTSVSTGTGTGSTVVINGANSRTFSELITQAVAYVTSNWWVMALLIVLALELFGVTHFYKQLAGPKKKKVVRKR